MQALWDISKFKAISYYSIYPIILSATHIISIGKYGTRQHKQLQHTIPPTKGKDHVRINSLRIYYHKINTNKTRICFSYIWTGYTVQAVQIHFSSFNHLHLRQGGANFPFSWEIISFPDWNIHFVTLLRKIITCKSASQMLRIQFPLSFPVGQRSQMYFSENAEPLQQTRGKNDWWVDLQNILVRHQILTDLCSLKLFSLAIYTSFIPNFEQIAVIILTNKRALSLWGERHGRSFCISMMRGKPWKSVEQLWTKTLHLILMITFYSSDPRKNHLSNPNLDVLVYRKFQKSLEYSRK